MTAATPPALTINCESWWKEKLKRTKLQQRCKNNYQKFQCNIYGNCDGFYQKSGIAKYLKKKKRLLSFHFVPYRISLKELLNISLNSQIELVGAA